jgi:hypothetical protein
LYVLRTNVSYELWLTMFYTLVCLDDPEMVLEGCPGLVPKILFLYCRNLTHMMESSGSSNESPPSDSGSHILITLDDGQMGLV